jgi:glutamate/tyrosine decarboxylase-like PLP-dependent enzyme
LDIGALGQVLENGDVGTVVATVGTTGLGAVDPIPELLELRDDFDFRLHVDAAYGGYFILADNLNPVVGESYARISEVDSIVVDPHKHGLQPYGCGCVLFKDPKVGRFYKHDSPYTYFTSDALHLGEISLECSRAGASAVGLWATQRLLPLKPGGVFAKGLSRSREAAITLFKRIEEEPGYHAILFPSLDILVWAPEGRTASQISERTEQVFMWAAEKNLHLAKIKIPVSLLRKKWIGVDFDQDEVVCLRACLMKPEHLDWIEDVMEVLCQVNPTVG